MKGAFDGVELCTVKHISNNQQFEVTESAATFVGTKTFLVDLLLKTCSCLFWQVGSHNCLIILPVPSFDCAQTLREQN